MKTRYDSYYRSTPTLGRNKPELRADGLARAPYQAPQPVVVRNPSVLEALHPDIVQALILLWGHPEMNLYFEKLWLADGTQAPIAPEAMSELMLLAGVHRWLSPERPVRNMASIYDASNAPSQRRDVWDEVPRRR
jgi:hypothetical protein